MGIQHVICATAITYQDKGIVTLITYPNLTLNRVKCKDQIHDMAPISRACHKQKQKYRGMFETQKSRNKTSSGDIGLNIRTLASPKVGQDQVSGGVSVLCRHATPVADALWKPVFSNNVKVGKKSSQGKP